MPVSIFSPCKAPFVNVYVLLLTLASIKSLVVSIPPLADKVHLSSYLFFLFQHPFFYLNASP